VWPLLAILVVREVLGCFIVVLIFVLRLVLTISFVAPALKSVAVLPRKMYLVKDQERRSKIEEV
jgi:hypothetical protein